MLRWFIYRWNVGTWRVSVSLGRIDYGNFPITPTINLGGLHCIHGRGIHTHPMIDCYRLDMCHDHRWNTGRHCVGIVICAHDDACNVVNKVPISPQISGVPCNQSLAFFVCIFPLVNMHISGQIQSFKHLIWHRLGCQPHRLTFIILLRVNIDLLMLRMRGLLQRRS